MKFHVIEKKKKKDNNSILEGMSKKLGLYPYQNPTRFLILFPFFLSSFVTTNPITVFSRSQISSCFAL